MRRRLMDTLAAFLLQHRLRVLTLLVGLALAASIYAARTLRPDADTDSLIGEHHPFMVEYRDFKRIFGDLEYLIIAVDAKPLGAVRPRHAEAKQAVVALVEALRADPELPEVHGFITSDEQWRLAPWSPGMSQEELRGLLLASDAFPSLLSRAPAHEVLAQAQARLDRLLSPGAETGGRAALEREGAAAIFALRAIAAGQSAGDAHFALATERPLRFLSIPDPPHELGRFLFVTILPRKDYGTLSVIREPLDRIRAVINQVQRQVPDVEIGLTGKPVLQADEMSTTNTDMTRAAIAGVGLVSLLFMVVFRSVRRPLLAVVAFGVGAAMTFGLASLLVGRLNLLSLVFMLVLVGVGLDYGIHMVARYSEGRRRLQRRGAIRHMIRTAVPSNLTGALIAGGTFLIALFTPFQGLRELGMIAGIGLVVCMMTMALLLPILLDLFDNGGKIRTTFIMGRERPATARTDRAELATRHLAILVIGLGLAITAAVVAPGLVRFESNLLKLQADTVDAVRWEKRIIEDDASETWFGAVVVNEIEDIPPVVEAAGREPAIGAVRSVLDLVAMPTPTRTTLLEALGEATRIPGLSAAASPTAAAPASARSNGLASAGAISRDDLLNAAGSVGRMALLAAVAAPAQASELRDLGRRLHALADELDPAVHSEAMISARHLAIELGLRQVARSLAQMGLGARGTLRDALPDAVRDEFTSESGHFCVRLHPAQDVWEFKPMQAFVAAMRRVDPQVTGVPITQFESMLLLERSFLIQGVASAIFVALVLFLDLRSIRETVACLVALGAALAWTLGMMALLGVSFNLANFFGIPIALGLGSDACIHIAHRAREGLRAGFGSTRRAVMVTALTTVIGFGGLLFAHHRGLQSLGVLMVISTLSMLAATTLLLPALLRAAARLPSRS